MAWKTARGCWPPNGPSTTAMHRARRAAGPAARGRGAPHAGAAPEAAGQRGWRAQPLDALHTARLLAKHQGFTPIAARGLLRSLAGEAIDDTHDVQQLQRLWQQLDAADRRDGAVAARAAARAVALGSTADAREWLRSPSGTAWATWSATTARPWRWACSRRRPASNTNGCRAWKPRSSSTATNSAVVAAVGLAFADRQLWGKARKLLEHSAAAVTLPLRVRRRSWRALAQMARDSGDEARALDCERAAAALE
jgi:HemY protein